MDKSKFGGPEKKRSCVQMDINKTRESHQDSSYRSRKKHCLDTETKCIPLSQVSNYISQGMMLILRNIICSDLILNIYLLREVQAKQAHF